MQYRLTIWLIVSALLHPLSSQGWNSTGGPQGGDVRALVLKGTTVFAGTDNGVWKSADEGQSWQYCSANARIVGLCVQGRYLFVMTENNGVWRSEDDGMTWEIVNIPVDPDRQVTMIDAAFGVIIAGASGGAGVLFMSRDSGKTWVELNTKTDFPRFYGCRSLLRMDSLLFLGSEKYGSNGGIICSRDSGMTWERVNDGVTLKGISILGRIDTVLFAGKSERTADEGCIFRSFDLGVTWEKAQVGLPQSSLKRVSGFGTSGNRIFAAVHEYSAPSYIAYRNSIYCSEDYGTSWRPLEQGLPLPDGNCFLTLPDRLLLSIKCGGVFSISAHDSNWKPANNGLSCMPVSSLCLMDGKVVCASFYHFIFEYAASNWKRLPVALPYAAHVTAHENTIAISSQKGVEFSNDIGGNWVMSDTSGIATGFKGAIPSFRGNPLYFHEGYVFCAKWDGVFRTRVSDMKTEQVFKNEDNTVSNEDWYFFTGNKGMMVAGFAGRLLFSKNTGATWSEKKDVCPYPTAAVFPVSGNTSKILIAEYDQGIYRSEDGGNSWSSPASQLQRINAIASWNGVLFAATKGKGVHVSYDTGATWSDFNTGLNYIRFITDLLVDDTLLYASTDGAGVWVFDLHKLGSSPVDQNLTQTGKNSSSKSWRLAVTVTPKNIRETSSCTRSFNLNGRQLSKGLRVNGVRCLLPSP